MRRIVQAAGWILLFAIVVISLGPPELRPDTSLPHDLEHAAMFLLAGFLIGLGYANGFVAWFLGLSAFALAIEIIQLWVPGRHARVSDFTIDVFAMTVGLVGGTILARFTGRS
jgi:VanZ family protein